MSFIANEIVLDTCIDHETITGRQNITGHRIRDRVSVENMKAALYQGISQS